MPSRYPLHMYHATQDPSPVYAMGKKEEDKYSLQGYQERYIQRDYPRNIHHISGSTVNVKNAAEEADYIGEGATHKGWSRTPFPKPEVAEVEPSVRSKSARESIQEVENFQKIQDLEFEMEQLKGKYEKLFDALTLQAEAIGSISDQVDALSPKKAKKEPEKAAT